MKLRDETKVNIITYIVVLVVLLGVHLGYNLITYGDPMCAFKKCVVIKGGENENS